MRVVYLLCFIPFLYSCSSGTTSTPAVPLYGHEVLNRVESNANTATLDYYVHPDTISKHGVKNVLLALTQQDCTTPCQTNLWDDRHLEALNRANPFGGRSEAWQRRHYVEIADHLRAFKDFGSDDIVTYPLTYDSRYKGWGGKLTH